VRGTLRFLFLYEVAEAIRLDALQFTHHPGAAAGLPTSTAIPQYLRFERPPAVESIECAPLGSGEHLEGRAKYYDYGVLCIELEMPFEGEWPAVVSQAVPWVGSATLENRAGELARAALARSASALVRPYENWLREDYYLVQIPEILGPYGQPLSAKELLASHSREIAQLVRAESLPLSEAECQEVLQSNISYSQTDLLVVGWNGAFVYGNGEVSSTTVLLLEYANTQLLEFRYYDRLMTHLLDDVYRSLERKGGFNAAWRLPRRAARLNTIRLDVMELTEKVDNAIKFLSDMFYARLYGLVAARVGVPDYRRLVDQKLRTAGELYRFMVEQFNQTRSFILELAVVIILMIDLFFLFRGK